MKAFFVVIVALLLVLCLVEIGAQDPCLPCDEKCRSTPGFFCKSGCCGTYSLRGKRQNDDEIIYCKTSSECPPPLVCEYCLMACGNHKTRCVPKKDCFLCD